MSSQSDIIKNSRYKDSKKTRNKFVATLKERGFISPACRHCNISRQTYYAWREKHPDFAKQCDAALEEKHEALLDDAEGMLMENINQGKEASIFFFLKTRGAKRGYIQPREDRELENKNTTNNFFLPSVAERTADMIKQVMSTES